MEYRLYELLVYARLDELLRDIGVLSTHPENRRMAPPSDTDVLLETVALCPDPHAGCCGGSGIKTRLPD